MVADELQPATAVAESSRVSVTARAVLERQLTRPDTDFIATERTDLISTLYLAHRGSFRKKHWFDNGRQGFFDRLRAFGTYPAFEKLFDGRSEDLSVFFFPLFNELLVAAFRSLAALIRALGPSIDNQTAIRRAKLMFGNSDRLGLGWARGRRRAAAGDGGRGKEQYQHD